MIKPGSITVELKNHNEFHVGWDATVPGYSVSVYLGRTEDEIDPDSPVAITCETRVQVAGLNSNTRPYFYLKGEKGDVHIAGQRCLPFQGAFNFRDMGGYPTRDGHRVKWGALYRSGHLSEITEHDLAYFTKLDIGLVCDFRRKDEQDLAPNRLPPGSAIRVANIPIHTGSQQSFIEKIATGKTSREDMMGVMKEINAIYARSHAPAFAAMFEHILAAPRGATLIHCTAGKDRTGFGTALILWSLGVDRETIMEDYLLSRVHFPLDRALERMAQKYAGTEDSPFDPRVMIPAFQVHQDYLNTALTGMEKKSNTIDRYISEEMGITRQMIAALRERFLY
jgi:protein-tyrosine phosphatase